MIAILFVFLVAVVAGYFIARVRIDDHYEVNSVFAVFVVVGPATVGALLGAVVGGLAARCLTPGVEFRQGDILLSSS